MKCLLRRHTLAENPVPLISAVLQHYENMQGKVEESQNRLPGPLDTLALYGL